MLSPTIVTEMPSLHVTVVKGIHEITCERGVVRIWTFDQHKLGDATERRINADLLMSLDDLLLMFDQVSTFIQGLGAEARTQVMRSLVPH